MTLFFERTLYIDLAILAILANRGLGHFGGFVHGWFCGWENWERRQLEKGIEGEGREWVSSWKWGAKTATFLFLLLQEQW